MAKTDHGKKKKPHKTVYTYKEYMEQLRPKSLGKIEETDNESYSCYDKLTLQKECALPYEHPSTIK